jgi:hypothetical protein
MSKKFRNLQGHSDPPITNDKKTLTGIIGRAQPGPAMLGLEL